MEWSGVWSGVEGVSINFYYEKYKQKANCSVLSVLSDVIECIARIIVIYQSHV